MSFKVTLDVTAESESHITGWAVDHLRKLGYHVVRPNEHWETIRAFLDRLGANYMTIKRALKKPDCPAAQIQWSESCKRMLAIRSNPAFDAFCRRHKK